MAKSSLHAPAHPVRFVSAASLFDGHDASINIMRRLLQSQGVEVVHLGHNRSVDEVVDAIIEEDPRLGLVGMMAGVVEECAVDLADPATVNVDDLLAGSHRALARAITCLE